jgi:hypothetical protein
MVSKPKLSNYIVLQYGTYGQPTVVRRYRVGARNEAEAEQLLRNRLGKHVQVKVYYKHQDVTLLHGTIIDDVTGDRL